jgi:hypothetical protein
MGHFGQAQLLHKWWYVYTEPATKALLQVIPAAYRIAV